MQNALTEGRMEQRRLILGVSGATGFVYAVRALELLKPLDVETHLVMSAAAEKTRQQETCLSSEEFRAMADVCYSSDDVGAAISSGSFQNMGMLIAPCSMQTLASVAHGTTTNLLTRAADVALKERRRLVLMTREAPLHLGHLRNMASVTEIGAIVFPPVPSLYNLPESIDAMLTHTVARALDLFGLDTRALPRWTGMPEDSGS